jgi:hypothetical protein
MLNEGTEAPAPAASNGACFVDGCQSSAASSSALQLLARLSRGASSNSKVLESAIQKMSIVLSDSLFSIESIACLVMAQQSQQTKDRVKQGTADIEQRFDKIMDQNRKRLKAIHDRRAGWNGGCRITRGFTGGFHVCEK